MIFLRFFKILKDSLSDISIILRIIVNSLQTSQRIPKNLKESWWFPMIFLKMLQDSQRFLRMLSQILQESWKYLIIHEKHS